MKTNVTTTEFATTNRSDLFKVDPRLIEIESGFNTREDFDIDEIKESIRTHGVLQPLTAWKKRGEDKWYLIDGERRYRAVMELISEGVEIRRVPLMVQDKPSDSMRTLDIVLRNSGKPLTPIELSKTYKRLINYGWSQAEVAKQVGKTQSHVNQVLGYLTLPEPLLEEVRKGNMAVSTAQKVANTIPESEINNVVSSSRQNDGRIRVQNKKNQKLIVNGCFNCCFNQNSKCSWNDTDCSSEGYLPDCKLQYFNVNVSLK